MPTTTIKGGRNSSQMVPIFLGLPHCTQLFSIVGSGPRPSFEQKDLGRKGKPDLEDHHLEVS